MTDDLDTRIAEAIAAVGTPPINLGDTGAVYDITGEENGGTGNPYGLARGRGEVMLAMWQGGLTLGGTTQPYGSLVFEAWPQPGLVSLTTVAGQHVTGVIAEPGGMLDQAQGLVQTDGLAYVLVASAVALHDRVRASATMGKAETIASGVGAFGYAVSASDGTGVWVRLTPGSEDASTALYDHGGLSGLADDDHAQYVLRADIVPSSDKLAGILPQRYTFYLGSELHDTTSTDHANVTDANDTTYAAIGNSVGGDGDVYEAFRWDMAAVKTFDHVRMVISVPTRFPILRVRTSDDGSTWSSLVEVTLAAVVVHTPGEYLIGIPQASCRYVELALLDHRGAGLSFYGTMFVYTLELHTFDDDKHKVLSDSHLDVNPADAATDGQALVWQTSSGKWRPGTILASGPAHLLSTRWEPMTNGDVTTPELVFADGDVVMVEVPT